MEIKVEHPSAGQSTVEKWIRVVIAVLSALAGALGMQACSMPHLFG